MRLCGSREPSDGEGRMGQPGRKLGAADKRPFRLTAAGRTADRGKIRAEPVQFPDDLIKIFYTLLGPRRKELKGKGLISFLENISNLLYHDVLMFRLFQIPPA